MLARGPFTGGRLRPSWEIEEDRRRDFAPLPVTLGLASSPPPPPPATRAPERRAAPSPASAPPPPAPLPPPAAEDPRVEAAPPPPAPPVPASGKVARAEGFRRFFELLTPEEQAARGSHAQAGRTHAQRSRSRLKVAPERRSEISRQGGRTRWDRLAAGIQEAEREKAAANRLAAELRSKMIKDTRERRHREVEAARADREQRRELKHALNLLGVDVVRADARRVELADVAQRLRDLADGLVPVAFSTLR